MITMGYCVLSLIVPEPAKTRGIVLSLRTLDVTTAAPQTLGVIVSKVRLHCGEEPHQN